MRRWNALLTVVLISSVLASCGGDESPMETPAPQSAVTVTAAVGSVSPTPEAMASATMAMPTATSAETSTPTVAASPTMVASLPFRVTVPVEAFPVDAAFVTLERWTWAAFGGTEEFAESGPGRSINYLDAGSELCFIAPIQGGADATIFRSDGTSETISSEQTQPTNVNVGDVTVYGDNNAVNCRNAGQTPSVTIVAGIWRVDPTLDMTLPGGLTAEVLAKGQPSIFPAEPAVVTIERLTLEPEMSVEFPEGAIALIFVEEGSVSLTGAINATVSRGIGTTIESSAGDAVALEAEDGAQLVASGSGISATAPSSIIVVTIDASS